MNGNKLEESLRLISGHQILSTQRAKPSHEPNLVRGRNLDQGFAEQEEARPHGEVPRPGAGVGLHDGRLRCDTGRDAFRPA